MIELRPAPSVLAARLRTVGARPRLVDAVRGIALDLAAPQADEYLSGDDYRRLRELVDRPVEDAVDRALELLAGDLERSLAGVDPALSAHLRHLREWPG